MVVSFGAELHPEWSRSQIMTQLAKMWKAAAPEEKLKYEVMPDVGGLCLDAPRDVFCFCLTTLRFWPPATV